MAEAALAEDLAEAVFLNDLSAGGLVQGGLVAGGLIAGGVVAGGLIAGGLVAASLVVGLVTDSIAFTQWPA